MVKGDIILILSLVSAVGRAFSETTRDFPCIDLAGIPVCGASSRLEEGDDWRTYHEVNLFDRSKDTAWVEGAEGDGIGEEIWFEVEPGLQELYITNGYASNAASFARNNRVRRLELTLWAGVQAPGMVSEIGPLFEACRIVPAWSAEVRDVAERQTVRIDLDWDVAMEAMEDTVDAADAVEHCAYILSLQIREVYRGTLYRDTCIDEIWWKLLPEYTGPGGLGRMELTGIWSIEDGVAWDRLDLEWFPFYQGWTAYVDDEPYDAGTWVMGGGRLVLQSDGLDAEFVFTGAALDKGRLVLVAEDGGTQVWRRW